MAQPFLAEIRIIAFNFAPLGWAMCDGQLLRISQNTALFSLLGTTYGGDGESTFALPDLTGRAPMHPDQGPGLSWHELGEAGGTETVSLLQTEIPAHSHTSRVSSQPATGRDPNGAELGASFNGLAYKNTSASLTPMHPYASEMIGGDVPHNNMMPYLTLHFAIALQGTFPSRP